MTDAVFLITEFRNWIYVLLGLLAMVYLRQLWRARGVLGRTPFGLEREAAHQRQNGALALLIILVALAVFVLIIDRYIAPDLRLIHATADSAARPPPPTATPVSAGAPLVIDSSGCENPEATLTEPQPNARISGSFEVRGTASAADFAFYTLELSGAQTNGVWVPLRVGSEPVRGGTLGTLDSSAYDSGPYALRLVVKDSAGTFPPPCVIPITIVAVGIEAPVP